MIQSQLKIALLHQTVAQRQDCGRNLEFKPYWRTRYASNSGQSDARPIEELAKELRTKLYEAVRLRLVSSDIAVGLLLSGGVDSGAVAGIAAEVAKSRLSKSGSEAYPLSPCFTIGFPGDDDLGESAFATRTVEHLDLPIEKVIIDEQILAGELGELWWLGEALLWGVQHVVKKALSKRISSRGLKAVLSVDGSDELIDGHIFHASDRLAEDDMRRAPGLLSS